MDFDRVTFSREMQQLAKDRTSHLPRWGNENTIHQLCIYAYLQGAYDMAYSEKVAGYREGTEE